jgi:hypothetical protein
MPNFLEIINNSTARKAFQVLISPWFLALLVTIPVFFLLIPLPAKYKLTIARNYNLQTNVLLFDDLDNDGAGDQIIANDQYLWKSVFITVKQTRPADSFQQIFRGNFFFTNNYFLSTGDFDNDRIKEIYFLTVSRDSLLLHQQVLPEEENAGIENYFVDIVSSTAEKPDLHVFFGEMDDLDKDGFKELIFLVNAGYSCQPRKVYAFNIRKQRLFKSPENMYQYREMVQFDINHDGFREVLMRGYASNNSGNGCDSTYLYNDNNSWLMALDSGLQFVFRPVLFPGKHSGIIPFTLTNLNKSVPCVQFFQQSDEFPVVTFSLFNESGNILKREILPDSLGKNYLQFIILQRGDQTHLFQSASDGQILEYSPNLEIVRKFNIGCGADVFKKMDLDKDGEDELILISLLENKLIIFRNNFSQPAELELVPFISESFLISLKQNKNQMPQLCLSSDQFKYLLDYGLNPAYPLRGAYFAGTYLFFLLFGLLVKKLQLDQIRRRQINEKQVTELQMKLVRNQLDPHFALNAVNSVIYAVINNEPDKAKQVLYLFVNLFKKTLLSAEQFEVPLKEELEFVENYLKMEQIRFRYKFSYSIQIGDTVNTTTRVPKMVIQTAVENAVKHGIGSLETGGLIDIKTYIEKNNLVIEVADNGVGREIAQSLQTSSTGLGLKLTNQFLKKYSILTGKKVYLEFKDLYNEDGKPSGSKVLFRIQLN